MSTPPAITATGEPLIRPISDLSYRNYDGPLRTRAARWWIVALSTIRANVNRSRFGYWIPAAIIVIYYLIRTIVFYVTLNVRANMDAMGMPIAAGPANPYTTELYGAMGGVPFSVPFYNLPLFVAALLIGSSSIASDIRANALLVYLSKPLTRIDYLVGKWMGIFLLLFALTFIPSFLMFLFFVGAYTSDGFLKDNPTLILRVIAAAALPAALHSSLIIGFSAWSKSSRVAGATYAAFYLIAGVLMSLVGNIILSSDRDGSQTGRAAIALHASVDGARNGLAQYIYSEQPARAGNMGGAGRRRNRKPKTDDDPAATPPDAPPAPVRPPLWSVLSLCGAMIILPLAAAQAKVRAVEVVKG